MPAVLHDGGVVGEASAAAAVGGDECGAAERLWRLHGTELVAVDGLRRSVGHEPAQRVGHGRGRYGTVHSGNDGLHGGSYAPVACEGPRAVVHEYDVGLVVEGEDGMPHGVGARVASRDYGR